MYNYSKPNEMYNTSTSHQSPLSVSSCSESDLNRSKNMLQETVNRMLHRFDTRNQPFHEPPHPHHPSHLSSSDHHRLSGSSSSNATNTSSKNKTCSAVDGPRVSPTPIRPASSASTVSSSTDSKTSTTQQEQEEQKGNNSSNNTSKSAVCATSAIMRMNTMMEQMEEIINKTPTPSLARAATPTATAQQSRATPTNTHQQQQALHTSTSFSLLPSPCLNTSSGSRKHQPQTHAHPEPQPKPKSQSSEPSQSLPMMLPQLQQEGALPHTQSCSSEVSASTTRTAEEDLLIHSTSVFFNDSNYLETGSPKSKMNTGVSITSSQSQSQSQSGSGFSFYCGQSNTKDTAVPPSSASLLHHSTPTSSVMPDDGVAVERSVQNDFLAEQNKVNCDYKAEADGSDDPTWENYYVGALLHDSHDEKREKAGKDTHTTQQTSQMFERPQNPNLLTPTSVNTLTGSSDNSSATDAISATDATGSLTPPINSVAVFTTSEFESADEKREAVAPPAIATVSSFEDAERIAAAASTEEKMKKERGEEKQGVIEEQSFITVNQEEDPASPTAEGNPSFGHASTYSSTYSLNTPTTSNSRSRKTSPTRPRKWGGRQLKSSHEQKQNSGNNGLTPLLDKMGQARYMDHTVASVRRERSHTGPKSPTLRFSEGTIQQLAAVAASSSAPSVPSVPPSTLEQTPPRSTKTNDALNAGFSSDAPQHLRSSAAPPVAPVRRALNDHNASISASKQQKQQHARLSPQRVKSSVLRSRTTRPPTTTTTSSVRSDSVDPSIRCRPAYLHRVDSFSNSNHAEIGSGGSGIKKVASPSKRFAAQTDSSLARCDGMALQSRYKTPIVALTKTPLGGGGDSNNTLSRASSSLNMSMSGGYKSSAAAKRSKSKTVRIDTTDRRHCSLGGPCRPHCGCDKKSAPSKGLVRTLSSVSMSRSASMQCLTRSASTVSASKTATMIPRKTTLDL